MRLARALLASALLFSLACDNEPAPACGDGTTDPGEACDGGPNCREDCTLITCGDGIVDEGEPCDEGAPSATCRENCTIPVCGDNILDPNEACDGGADCRPDCTLVTCGDGQLDPGEDCDGGADCREDCTIPACGDLILDPGEDCDGGPNCRPDCTLAVCGDGVVDPGEDCDGSAECRADCTLPGCGDGVLDAGEGCDDGNNLSEDGCAADCVAEFCGDGIAQAGLGEECDDGNFLPGDSCDPICQNPPVEDTFLFTQVQNLFDTAEYCDQITNRHKVVRALDLQDGNLRWRCGDVTGISPSQYGQEYCEYSAIQGGLKVQSASQLDQGESFRCLFTAVFNDNAGGDSALAAALASAENLGEAPPLNTVRMQRGVNSRSAADGLIGSCSTMNGNTNEVRQTACYQAFDAAREAGDTARADQLRGICRGQTLDDARFAQAQALGAQILTEADPGFQTQREIRACVATARGGGAFFRNSDTAICGRVFRANNECQCSFDQLPPPPAINGFFFADWVTPENTTLPPECRPAIVNGQAHPQLLICEVPPQELPEIAASPRFSQDLTGFCNERFGKNIGLLAPLGAIVEDGSCNETTAFCSDFQ